MQKCNAIIMLLATIMVVLPASAQKVEETVPLAILPFVLSRGALIGNPADVVTVQEIVTKEFTDKGRFVVLDRSKFDKIIDELKIQSMEEFMNSRIVEQGKQQGAKYLVAGVLNEYKVTRLERVVLGKSLGNTYPCTIKMSFGVIDVETGQLMMNSPINVASNDVFSMDSVSSSKKALANMQDGIKAKIRTIFTGALQIQGIDKVGKDGLPETVLINGGNSVINEGKDAKNIKIGVYLIQMVGEYKREKEIGELRVDKVEGQLVVCEVKSGAKEIDDAYKAKTTMLLKIISKK